MLTRLSLTDYRNHAALDLAPGPGFVVLAGDNGAGKTNILEAISLLAPGRGLRRAALGEMAREGGAGGFGVAAAISGDVSLATGTAPDAPDRRVVRIQGASAAATALADWLSVLWITPVMDRLFLAAAGDRRRFLDRLTLALYPAHAVHANRYEAAMRARNRLLADQAVGRAADPHWLAALEAQMAEHGAAIEGARAELVALLDARLAASAAQGFARARLALEGWGAPPERLADDLASGRRRDTAAGRALAGPHRSDLAVTDAAKDRPAAHCSTGEQKSLLLAIVLAHAELVAAHIGRAPVLLLDEVAAHLDPRRRAALFARLGAIGQVWMTGTEPALFAELGAGATRYVLGAGGIDAA